MCLNACALCVCVLCTIFGLFQYELNQHYNFMKILTLNPLDKTSVISLVKVA